MAKTQSNQHDDVIIKDLIERLIKDEQIEYVEEAKDQAEECWVCWDLAEYAVDHPNVRVVSVFKTPEEAAKAWSQFQIRGNAGEG